MIYTVNSNESIQNLPVLIPLRFHWSACSARRIGNGWQTYTSGGNRERCQQREAALELVHMGEDLKAYCASEVLSPRVGGVVGRGGVLHPAQLRSLRQGSGPKILYHLLPQPEFTARTVELVQ